MRIKTKVYGFLLFILTVITWFTNTPVALAAKAQCVLTLQTTSTKNESISPANITYSYVVKNSGSAKCNFVSVSVFYDKNETYLSSNKTPSGSTNYYWFVGTLLPAKTYSLSVTTKNSLTNTLPIVSEACASATNATDSCTSTTNTITTPPVTPIDPAPTPLPTNTKELGIWIWDSPYTLTVDQMKQKIDSLAPYG